MTHLPTSRLPDLEATTHETGNAIVRRTLQAQSDVVDAALAEQYRQRFSPSAAPRRRARNRPGR